MNVTVTVTVADESRGRDALGSRYTVSFDARPGRTLGPWGFGETCGNLAVSAPLPAPAARALVLDAWTDGEASRPTGGKGRAIPRGRREFAELRSTPTDCVVVSRDNDYRLVERPSAQAWELLDRDPKARLLDLGGGVYRVERKPRPMWYELTRKSDDA